MPISHNRPPNVVWVTLDSVRLDHTSLGGYQRDTTPNLARIAEGDGRAFSQCIAHGMYTLASTASILSGTYPSHHRVGLDGERLPDGIPTVAERFGHQGYRTACLSRNSYLSPATGLDRGFDDFAWLSASTLFKEAGWRLTIDYLRNIRRHSAGFTLDAAKHSTPYVVNAMAERWLDDFREDEPFFFYLHYNEPHRPYYPPLPYLETYTDDIEMSATEAAGFAMDVHENLYEHIADGLPFSDEEWRALVAMYDAEIAYTDEFVGRLYDRVRSLNLGETVFVVTADHGELFGERGLIGHQYLLDDALVNVPLVVSGLDVDGLESDALLQHADLMTTLLGVAGADVDGLQGVDLRSETRRHTIAQRHAPEYEHVTKHNPSFDIDRYHRGELSAIRSNEFKLLKSEDRRELFALSDESTDVAETHPDTADDLEAALDEWLATDGRPFGKGADAEFTDDMRRQLRDLGYME